MHPDAPICQMSPGTKHFPGWSQKCFKIVLCKPLGVNFRAGARNPLKQCSKRLLGSVSGLGPEMLQNSSLQDSWAHFPGWTSGFGY